MAETVKGADNFEQYLVEHPIIGSPENLYDAMNYIMQLGGKRMRPKLLLMAYESCAGTISEDALQLALAIETFHNFSLVHDDIMDNAPIRRGQQTVHKKWDNATAILAGDNLLIKCYELILKTEIKNKVEILQLFTKTATEVCEGQQMDVDMPLQKNVTEEGYLEMIKLKTAVLPACALKIGALAANSDSAIANEFYNFGLNLGMAFQLQDDYLDTFGTAEEIGKQVGGDISENKKTILYLHAMKNSDSDLRNKLESWYTGKVHDGALKIEEVRQIFMQRKSDIYLLQLKKEYEVRARLYLTNVCTDQQVNLIFLQLLNSLESRKK